MFFNFTGDELFEPAEVVEFTITIVPAKTVIKRSPEAEPIEPIAEAVTPEPPTAKAPDISIHQAAGKGNIAAVKQHLATGTDVNARNDGGYTPLDVAMVQKNTEIIDLLLGRGGKSAAADSMHVAALTGNIEAVKQHLAAGTDVNWTDENGGTLLHYVAVRGHKGIAELLISKGADVNAKIVTGQNQGETPLDQAIKYNYIKTADLLRKHGAKTGEELKAAGN